jgi:hypothetical protein
VVLKFLLASGKAEKQILIFFSQLDEEFVRLRKSFLQVMEQENK